MVRDIFNLLWPLYQFIDASRTIVFMPLALKVGRGVTVWLESISMSYLFWRELIVGTLKRDLEKHSF